MAASATRSAGFCRRSGKYWLVARRGPYLSRRNDLAELTADLADRLDIPQAEEAGTDGGDPLAL